MNPSPNFWIVGAKWDEKNMEEEWVQQGIWMLGWNPAIPEHKNRRGKQFYDRADQIRMGDRIAIKRWNGRDRVNILHIGIATSNRVILDEGIIFCVVNWINKEPLLDREVCSHGWGDQSMAHTLAKKKIGL